jgi:hypothetical protein
LNRSLGLPSLQPSDTVWAGRESTAGSPPTPVAVYRDSPSSPARIIIIVASKSQSGSEWVPSSAYWEVSTRLSLHMQSASLDSLNPCIHLPCLSLLSNILRFASVNKPNNAQPLCALLVLSMLSHSHACLSFQTFRARLPCRYIGTARHCNFFIAHPYIARLGFTSQQSLLILSSTFTTSRVTRCSGFVLLVVASFIFPALLSCSSSTLILSSCFVPIVQETCCGVLTGVCMQLGEMPSRPFYHGGYRLQMLVM